MIAGATPTTYCPNCAATSDQARNCDRRGEWGEADEVCTCNNCNTTYGHAVTVGYFIEAYEEKP